MRRKEQEVTDRTQIEAILNAALICRLGLCRDNVPYVVPVNYAYDNGHLYFHSSQAGMKMDMLRANPRVCFEVDVDAEVTRAEQACGFSINYRSVIGWGTAIELHDPEDKRRALDLLMAHHGGPQGPYRPGSLARAAVVRIDIETMTGKQHGFGA